MTCIKLHIPYIGRGHRGRGSMVVRFTTTYVISSNPAYGEMHSIQHYLIKFVCDLRQVDGFLRVLWFLPPVKLTAMIKLKYC